MKKISVSDLSGLNKIWAGVSPAQGANVNANVNGAVAMAPRAASADSSDDDEPPVWHFYMYDAVVEAEYYRPYEPKEEEPDPGYGGGGGGGPEWPNEGYSYNSYSGYSQAYGYYGYGSDQTVDPDPEPQPNPNPDPEPKPQPTKPDWNKISDAKKIAVYLNGLKEALKSGKPCDISKLVTNFPKAVSGAILQYEGYVAIGGEAMYMHMNIGVNSLDMKVSPNGMYFGTQNRPGYGNTGYFYFYKDGSSDPTNNGMVDVFVPEEHVVEFADYFDIDISNSSWGQ